jgi:hypothetical protein
MLAMPRNLGNSPKPIRLRKRPRTRERLARRGSAYRRERRFAYNKSFAGEVPGTVEGVAGEMGSVDVNGRGGNPKTVAAPLSVLDD